MYEQRNVHPSVRLNAELLKSDRKAAGYTQISFEAACGSVSLATIRRAEQGYRVIESALRRMSAVLHHDYDRYVASNDPSSSVEYVAWIAGEWSGYYVETDHTFLPFIVPTNISIKQKGDRIEGNLLSETPAGHRTEKFMDCTVRNNILHGYTRVEGLPLPRGLAAINQVSSRNNDWLEGFSTWFDSRTGSAEASRYIAVRKSSPFYEQYNEEAQVLIGREVVNFRLRKLFEAGYSLGDAVAMTEAYNVRNEVDIGIANPGE